jgi:hypothetical protein
MKPGKGCGLQVHPHPDSLQHHLNLDQTNPTLETGALRNGDWPNAATRAVVDETHAVGAMVQEKQYLHAPLEELAILI